MVELLSTVIEHLVKGEIMQMKPSATGKSALDYYLRKNFYKTASLMGHSCLAAAVLGTVRTFNYIFQLYATTVCTVCTLFVPKIHSLFLTFVSVVSCYGYSFLYK